MSKYNWVVIRNDVEIYGLFPSDGVAEAWAHAVWGWEIDETFTVQPVMPPEMAIGPEE